MMNLDTQKLEQIIQEAFDRAGNDRRWQTAIAKAKQQLESNPFMHFDGDALLILSPSNEIYRANGMCQCAAFVKFARPCWHRAAARIITRYTEHGH
jgi:chloramphenicol 3-O-phosphotransferase